METREELEATLEKIPKGKPEVELKIVAKYKKKTSKKCHFIPQILFSSSSRQVDEEDEASKCWREQITFLRLTSKSSVDLEDDIQEDLSQVSLKSQPFTLHIVFVKTKSQLLSLSFWLPRKDLTLLQMSYYIFQSLQYECVMCEEKHYHTKRLFVVRDLPGYQVDIKID